MKTIKVSEATNIQLDWLVARALGKRPSLFVLKQTGALATEHHYTTDWSQMGPIIERECISTDYDKDWVYDPNNVDPDDEPDNGDRWRAWPNGDRAGAQYGATPLIAAARCFITSKLGETVEVPEEL